MSSEESLSPDTTDSKNNNKNKMKPRKPDMLVYVPRPKRGEDGSKQKMSSDCPPNFGNDASRSNSTIRSPSMGQVSQAHQVGGALLQKEFRPTWSEKEERNALKEKTRKGEGGDRNAAKQAITTVGGKKGPPQQPQTNKLPSQVIEEMMKRHNISVAAQEKSFLLVDDESSTSSVAEGKIQGDDETAPTAKAEGDSAFLSHLPASYQEFVMEEIATNAAAASQRLASVQPVALLEHGRSESLTSTSPTSSETPEIVQQLNSMGGGRGSPCFDADDLEVKLINESFEEAQKQMQLYGSEQVKKAFYSQPNPVSDASTTATVQLLPKPRKALASDSSMSNASSTIVSTGASKVRRATDGVIEPVISPALMKPVSTATTTKSTSNEDSKLTWAGWGATKPDPKTGAVQLPSTETKSKKEDSFAADARKPQSGDLDGAVAMELFPTSMPLVPSVVSSVSSPTAVFDSPPGRDGHFYEIGTQSFACGGDSNDAADTNEMDMLSAAMIEKVLSEDMDDFDTAPSYSKSTDLISFNDTPKAVGGCDVSPIKDLPSDVWSRDDSVGASGGTASTADTWEDLLSEPGDKVVAQLFQQVQNAPVNKKAERDEINYFLLKPKDIAIDDDGLGHVLEARVFSASMKGDELYFALRQLHCREFRTEWVDDTHALVIFPSAFAAREACHGSHPAIKLRPLSQASIASTKKAKALADTMLPFSKKPDTNPFLARRLVENHLGRRSELNAEQRKREQAQLQQARDQKRIAAQQREDAWEGRL